MDSTQWPLAGKPPASKRTPPAPRAFGATTKIYRVTNNFETYITLEPVSQEYISKYIAYCTINKKMHVKDVRFNVEEVSVFLNNSRIGRY